MARVVHLVDDPALGGVNRLLDSIASELSGTDRHDRLVELARMRVSPPIAADVIVVHFTLSWSKLPFLASLRLRAPRARLVLVEHSYTAAFEAACVPSQRRFRAMLRLGYRLVDLVISVSEGQARWMRKAGLVRPARLRVIPCVNDLSAFASLPYPKPDTPMKLGAFGRFDRQKGYETLLDAMELVPPEVATLDLAGYGPEGAALRARAEGLKHVTMHERVDPVAFCSQMNAIAIPSRWEAGAVTCWEARAAGRPLIVSNVDGLPEQISPDIGIVVEPEDVSGWAKAICDLALLDRAAMAAAARQSSRGAFQAVIAAWREALFPS